MILVLTQIFASTLGICFLMANIDEQIIQWGAYGFLAALSIAAAEILRNRERNNPLVVSDMLWLVALKAITGIGGAVGSGLGCLAFAPESSSATQSAIAFAGGLVGKEIPTYVKLAIMAWLNIKDKDK